MNVDVSHRDRHAPSSRHDYDNLRDELSDALSNLSSVVSVRLCGSILKGDLVPGWSDLDIIAFTNERTRGTSALDEVRLAFRRATGGTTIGVGIDIVDQEEFRQTLKLCGRPYMMTYEVAFYGEQLAGPDLFTGISYDTRGRDLVTHERPALISSEIHSWRRRFIQYRPENADTDWLFQTAKALLRLLQCETGPNLVLPLGAAGSLQRLRQFRPDHPALPAFEEAITIRNKWPRVLDSPDLVRSFDLPLLEAAIDGYPIPADVQSS